jgi:EmrB/QacA subfamily drug resistance transporter
MALASTVAASSMASLDVTIVNVAVPHIGADFDAEVSALQWVLTGYLVSLASLILLGGALGDRFGRRRVFLIGTVWFAGASLLCGLAPSIEVLVATRVLQGVGGALLTPGSLAILQAGFRPDDRAAAIGAWSGFGGVAVAVGPFLGGAIVDGPGWRWAFVLNVPVAVLVVVLARVAVVETRDMHATGRLDVAGAVLAVVGLGAATWALTEAGPRSWGDVTVVAAGVVSITTLVAFVAHVRRAPAPLVPPALFRNRVFTVINLGTLLLYAPIGLVFFLVAYELQVVAGWTAVEAGAALLPTTMLLLVLSSLSGRLSVRIGPRPQLTVGPLLTAAGLLLLTRIGEDPSWATDVLPGSFLLGIGLATFVAPLTATVMAAADPDYVNTASGVNNAVARAASLTALAVVPVVAGLSSASDSEAVTSAVHVALVIAAVLAAAASPVMAVGLGRRARAGHTVRDVHCAVDAPPIEPAEARPA